MNAAFLCHAIGLVWVSCAQAIENCHALSGAELLEMVRWKSFSVGVNVWSALEAGTRKRLFLRVDCGFVFLAVIAAEVTKNPFGAYNVCLVTNYDGEWGWLLGVDVS